MTYTLKEERALKDGDALMAFYLAISSVVDDYYWNNGLSLGQIAELMIVASENAQEESDEFGADLSINKGK